MKKEVIEKLAALITAGFGLVAALAWNDAIRSLFSEGGPLFFLSDGGPWVYAVIVTFIAVFVTIWIGEVSQRAEDSRKSREEAKAKVKVK